MEILLVFLALSVVCLLVAMAALYAMMQQERKRADTVELKYAMKFEEAMLRASVQLQNAEVRIRADAVKKSKEVVTGKVAEHMVPFREDFGFNPRDCRFLGGPIDFIVFVGLTEGDLNKVVFIEVKTGKSRLSRRQRQLRNVIDEGEVYWEELRV